MRYDHSHLTVNLLDGCNRQCRHCYRTMVPSDHGFSLSADQVQAAIRDAQSLCTLCLFAGGEPTIWRSGESDFLSVLTCAANTNGSVAFLSNGYVFCDRPFAMDFVDKYMAKSGRPMRMMFTVDLLHENYDAASSAIPFLDNLLAARDRSHAEGTISFRVVSHWTRSDELNVPESVLDRYQAMGVDYGIDDFMVWGRAEALEAVACYLVVDSRGKEGLGPFGRVLARKLVAAGCIDAAADLDKVQNRNILRALSVCGRSPNFTISWGNRYYHCIPQMGHEWFSPAQIGSLDGDALASFYARRPVIREIRNTSIFGLLDGYGHMVNADLLNEISNMRESVRFAGCSVCLKLFERGILQQINEAMLREGDQT